MKRTNVIPFNQNTHLTDRQFIERIVLEGLYGKYVTKVTAAKILRVSRQTIYNMIADGRLKTSYTGRVSIYSIFDEELRRKAS